ncbi:MULTISPECIES: hypothetical protein [Paenibacillus]|uniref:hypothetical protein n=1 Tax=Paenibacillus TaxID=44249 RepID=UPI0012B99696|nr:MULTISPECIES: hypothetical protein [Paenibacillus]
MSKWEIVSYVAIFVYTLVMLLNDQSILLVLGTVLVAGLIMFSIFVLYPMVWETRMDRLEAFLRRKQNAPYIYIIYATANRLDEEVELTMEKLMSNTSASKSTKANYQAAYGAYRKDLFTVRKAVREMRKSVYRTYYETFVLIEEGETERAREHLGSIKREWMRFALLAEIERKLDHYKEAEELAAQAVQASKGVHRYAMTKEYERYYTKEQHVQ